MFFLNDIYWRRVDILSTAFFHVCDAAVEQKPAPVFFRVVIADNVVTANEIHVRLTSPYPIAKLWEPASQFKARHYGYPRVGD